MEAEDERLRQAAGEIFSMLSDDERENAATIAQDCLRNLHIQKLQHDMNELTELMKTAADSEARAKALRELTDLSKELARLKQGR